MWRKLFNYTVNISIQRAFTSKRMDQVTIVRMKAMLRFVGSRLGWGILKQLPGDLWDVWELEEISCHWTEAPCLRQTKRLIASLAMKINSLIMMLRRPEIRDLVIALLIQYNTKYKCPIN